jgi:phage terminase small subunit
MAAVNLSAKQLAFVREYLVDMNATQAAIRVGYSAKTAGEQASRLLADVRISDAIMEAVAGRAERTEITADRVLKELHALAFFDTRNLFNADGTLKAIPELDAVSATALGGFELQETTGEDGKTRVVTKKVKLLDRNSAIEKAMRHLGMFNDKQTHRHEFEGLTQEELDARIAALSAKK